MIVESRCTRVHLTQFVILAAITVFFFSSAQAFDRQPHVLIMPGHTSSVEWDHSAKKYVPTCDYKTLSGAAPRRGQPCDGSPRLSITTEDLRDLRYITSTRDINELVRRVYERFDNILFIASPDYQRDYGGLDHQFEAAVLTERHPLVSSRDYEQLAQMAHDQLRLDNDPVWGNTYALGVIHKPHANPPDYGTNSLTEPRPILPEYALVFLPKNPMRTTLIHELLHFLIHRARERAIYDPDRLMELAVNEGKADYIEMYVRADLDAAKRQFGEEYVAELEAMDGQFGVEFTDLGGAEELEIAYFNGLYGAEMLIPNQQVDSEKYNFWQYSDFYSSGLQTLHTYAHQGYVSGDTILEYARANAPLPPPLSTLPNPLRDLLPIPSFRALWAVVEAMSAAYPQNLLGNEHQINRSNPRTMMDYFVTNVGTRAATAARR